MTTPTTTTLMRRFALAIATLGLAACLGALGAPGAVLALDTPDYTPGEDYYIDTPEAFRKQQFHSLWFSCVIIVYFTVI